MKLFRSKAEMGSEVGLDWRSTSYCNILMQVQFGDQVLGLHAYHILEEACCHFTAIREQSYMTQQQKVVSGTSCQSCIWL